MRKINLAISAVALSVALSATGHAQSYNYEIAVLYDASRASSESGFTGPVRPVEPISFELESDNDEVGLSGTWFFEGVAASTGPLSRAAFISRASAVSLSYTRGSGETVFTVNSIDPAFPSFTETDEQSRNSISANLRWVWPESGWYGLAGLSRADFEADNEFVSTELTADAFSLGFGKYIGAQTALELSVVRVDSDASGAVLGGSSTATDAAVGLTHIGNLGGTWQYGTDIALSTTTRGTSDGSYSVRLSLYPSRPLAFGIDIDGPLQDPGDGSTGYGLFASWFPRERIEFDVRFRWLSVDEPINTDLDQYDFGMGVNVRF